MHFSTLASCLAIAGFALAQTPTSSAASGQVSVHVIQVSNAQAALTYSPNSIQANVGDMVQFQFYPKNHSVVQSTFDQPCQPIQNINASVPGFFSGFQPVSLNQSSQPTFTIMVQNTSPIWFYCAQAKHCQGGMVGVVNPPASNSSKNINAFAQLAAQAPNNVVPNCMNSTNTTSSTPSGSAPTAATSSTFATSAATTPASTTSPAAASATKNAADSFKLTGQNTHLASAGLIAMVIGLFL